MPIKQKIYSSLTALSNWKGIVPTLFFLALATRIAGAVLGGSGGNRGDDDGMFLEIANNYLSGRGFYMFWQNLGPLYCFEPPGMPIFHIIFITLFKNFAPIERIFFILMSSVCFTLFFLFAQKFFSRPIALLGTLGLIFYPTQWFWSTRINGHAYATNMLFVALYLLFVAWEKRSLWIGFVVGLIWGTMSLMRPEYLPVIFILCFGSLLKYRGEAFSRKLTLVLVAGWFGVLAPWGLRNYQKIGRFVLSSTHYSYNLWMVFNDGYTFGGETADPTPELAARLADVSTSESKLVDIWVDEAMTYIKTNPKKAAHHVMMNFLNYWRPWLSFKKTSPFENAVYIFTWVPVFLLFLMALTRFPYRDEKWLIIGLFVLYKALAHLPFYMIVRFREATFPIFVLIALIPLAHWFEEEKTNRPAVPESR